MSTPEYLRVSKAFRIGKGAQGNCSGVVIASPDAFYFVVGMNIGELVNLLAGVSGVLRLLGKGKKEEHWVEPGSNLIETDLAELPLDIRGHADWPAKQDKGKLLIVPRDAISSVSYSFWKWGIFVQTKEIEFRIEPPLFGRKKLLQSLREMGWQI